MTKSPTKVLLEVERKFSKFKVNHLKANGGFPCFRSLVPLGTRKFRDVYFDHARRLSSRGVWLRQRDDTWQMKVRQGGNYKNSSFHETSDIFQIADQVSRLLGSSKTSTATVENNFGLSPTANIITNRQSWKADDRFNIVLDRTDFGHVVGEVELELETYSLSESRDIMIAMDKEIIQFLWRYTWAFDVGNPVGKLSAYFSMFPNADEGSLE